jgi:hypothetical protein
MDEEAYQAINEVGVLDDCNFGFKKLKLSLGFRP